MSAFKVRARTPVEHAAQGPLAAHAPIAGSWEPQFFSMNAVSIVQTEFYKKKKLDGVNARHVAHLQSSEKLVVLLLAV